MLSTLLFVMLRVLQVLARIVLSVTLCYLFLCSQCLYRWFFKKLVFLLFYNGDIILVSEFLYFFLFWTGSYTPLSTNATVTHICLPILLYYNLEIKQPRFPLLHLMFRTNPPGEYIHTCIITRQHLAPNKRLEAFDGKKATEPLMVKCG